MGWVKLSKLYLLGFIAAALFIWFKSPSYFHHSWMYAENTVTQYIRHSTQYVGPSTEHVDPSTQHVGHSTHVAGSTHVLKSVLQDQHSTGDLPSTSTIQKQLDNRRNSILPTPDGTQLEFYPHAEIENLRKRTSDKPECRAVSSLWRPSLTGAKFTAEDDYRRMHTASQGCGVPLDPNFLMAKPRPQLYDFEKRYLDLPSLTDRSLASSETYSVVHLLDGRLTYDVGDNISLRVDMRNGRDEPVLTGGDEIRVWLKDLQNRKFMAADVQDLGNGSHLATGLLPWPGKLELCVGLAHTSAFIRIVTQIHLVFKTLEPPTGMYGNLAASEATACSHVPLLPFYTEQEICNLTEVNRSPWFCGRPAKRELDCSDFKGTRGLGNVEGWKIPVSDVELQELERPNKHPRVRRITKRAGTSSHDTYYFTVVDSKGSASPPTRLCHEIPPQETWTQKAPTGFYDGTKWNFLSCSHDRSTLEQCFTNVSMYFLGDSNARNYYYGWRGLAGATEHVNQTVKAWHKPLHCSNRGNNFRMSWEPHANPFRSSGTVWAILGSGLLPSASVIDNIPSGGRVLVVLHHYFHLTMDHISAYHGMITSVRDAVRRLVHRNPEAQVLVLGPHVTYKGWPSHYVGGDGLARFMEDLLVSEYSSLRHRVVYFRPWELTLATENHDFHPTAAGAITDAMVQLMCGR